MYLYTGNVEFDLHNMPTPAKNKSRCRLRILDDVGQHCKWVPAWYDTIIHVSTCTYMYIYTEFQLACSHRCMSFLIWTCQLGCLGSSDGKSICLECIVSWVQIPPEATHFHFFIASGVCLPSFLSFISSVIMYIFLLAVKFQLHLLWRPRSNLREPKIKNLPGEQINFFSPTKNLIWNLDEGQLHV